MRIQFVEKYNSNPDGLKMSSNLNIAYITAAKQ